MDIDTVGAAATAGVIAGAIEKPAGEAGEAHATCTDCGAEVSGKFCSNCGQPTHVHRSLLHLVEEVLHGVLHFDARIWRTLPLLAFNPGKLTREWVQGKRTRYVSPLAMFLFTVFVMFFVFSFTSMVSHQEAPPQPLTAAERADLTEQLQATRASLAETRRALAESPGSEALAMTVRANETMITALETRLGQRSTVVRTDGLTPGSWQATVRDAFGPGGSAGLGEGWLAHKLEKKAQNPDLAVYKLQQTVYKFSFLLIPLSIPFVALLFLWKRGFTLYDHGVFVLYSLTAMSILFLLIAVLGPLWSVFGFLGFLAVVFGIPAHMFAQLKGAYGLSIFSTLWRTAFLLIFSLLSMALFMSTIIALGFTG